MNLESLFGTIVRGMAYPMGSYNDALVEALQNIGIAYSRTCISTHDFRLPTDWLRLTAICHHNDPKLFELADRFITESPLNQPFHRESWLFYLWGHSYEFDDHNNWDRMETFAEKAGQKEDVWYATNIEIYDYINAYNNLKFSINGDYVYNPSCFPIWLKKNRTLFCVKPNDQIHI